MAKKTNMPVQDPESVREAPAAPEVSQDIPETETAPQASESSLVAPELAPEPELVRYRVAWPAGLWLRLGPGRAYHPLAVLPAGAEVMGVELAGMLREDRQPNDAAWLKIICSEGAGWVNAAFLERV